MRLLLDTHTFLWWDSGELDARVVRKIQAADDVFVSAVTAWEIAIKSSSGKLSALQDVDRALRDYGFSELPITIDHVNRLRDLPNHHRDPFDRMLVAQAMSEKLAVVSKDSVIARYPVRVLWR